MEAGEENEELRISNEELRIAALRRLSILPVSSFLLLHS
jgi:hypothetical protein